MTERAVPLAKRLTRVHPDAARVSRVAFDARFQRWLQEVFQQPDVVVARRLPPERPALIEVECGEGHFQLALDAFEWPALDMALALEDDACACDVATALLMPQAEPLAGVLTAMRVRRRRRLSGSRRADSCAVIATSRWRGALLRLDEGLRQYLGNLIAGVAPRTLRSLGQLRIAGRLRLLVRELPVPALSALRTGDVVLLGDPAPGQALVFGKGATLQFNITVDLHSGSATVTEGGAMRSEDAGPDDWAQLDELQVPVSFEVDTARITLAELASMRPGYVVELDRPLASATVRLVCHGQTVGHGQLVAVGDQMGIRIVSMGLAARRPGSAE